MINFFVRSVLESGVFIDSVDPELDEIRRTFLRNIMKGSNSHTLNIVSRDSIPVTMPQIVFKFASIGGVEGGLFSCCMCFNTAGAGGGGREVCSRSLTSSTFCQTENCINFLAVF